MNDAELTPDQLHLEVLKAMGWRHGYDATQLKAVWINQSGDRLDEPPPLTLDLMWQAIHPDKPLAEEITRQAKEFLKLQK